MTRDDFPADAIRDPDGHLQRFLAAATGDRVLAHAPAYIRVLWRLRYGVGRPLTPADLRGQDFARAVSPPPPAEPAVRLAPLTVYGNADGSGDRRSHRSDPRAVRAIARREGRRAAEEAVDEFARRFARKGVR